MIKLTATPSMNVVKRRIEMSGKKLHKTEIAHKKCSVILDQWVLKNFATEGGNVGGWPKFKYPEFGRYLPRKGWDPSAKLLRNTGTLMRSYRPWYSRRDAGIGSDLKYAKPHDKGEGHLPQRRMLPRRELDSDLMRKFREVFKDHVKTSLKL